MTAIQLLVAGVALIATAMAGACYLRRCWADVAADLEHILNPPDEDST